jgi:iron(III) transport system ATP-binding protein
MKADPAMPSKTVTNKHGTSTDEPALRIIALKKHFQRLRGGTVTAVDGVSLDIAAGEMVVILGPSGCGKTSLLRSVAGLEMPSGGEIYSNGKLIFSSPQNVRTPPEHRGFGMMFQSYAVWPHMNVFGNVSYPLSIKRVPKQKIFERVSKILDVVGIGHLADEYPTQLSGGQQQRVALARSLVADPKIMLFDEPLSNVDAKVRDELRIEIRAMQRRIGFAGIFVTHDQEEATAIADRIVVMRNGHFVQVGSPRVVYGSPATRFVARFLGVVNEWEGVLQKARSAKATTRTIKTDLGDLVVAAANIPASAVAGDDVFAVVRPESIFVTTTAPPKRDWTVWKAEVDDEIFRGPYVDRFLKLSGTRVRSRGNAANQMKAGEKVYAVIDPDAVRVIVSDLSNPSKN